MHRHLSPAEAAGLHGNEQLAVYYDFDDVVDHNVTNLANPGVNDARLGFYDSELEAQLPEQYRPLLVPRCM